MVPSGPVDKSTGRKRSSVDARNSALSVRLPGAQRRAVVAQNDAAHEVGAGLRNEDVSVELRRQPVAAIDHRRADRCEAGERAVRAVDACLVGTVGAGIRAHGPHGVQLVRIGRQPLVAPARAQQVRVAREVRGGHEVDVQGGLVRVAIDAPAVVLRHTPLASLERLLHLELAVPEAQVDIGHARRVHRVVQRPVESVRVVLRVDFEDTVPVGDQLLRIHPQITVGVVHQPGVRRLPDQHAAIEDLDGPCQLQAIREHRALVHPSVAVQVLQDDDPPDRIVLIPTGDVGHVAGHLHRPQPALRIPVDRDRLLDHRLACHELEVIARRHEEGFQRVLRRQRR